MEKEILSLINGVKSGRREDFDIIKGKYAPLVNDMAKSFESSGAGPASDLRQEAESALLKACLTFDETKEGITFGLYAKVCIRNALISVLRSVGSQNRKQKKQKKEKTFAKAKGILSFGSMDAEEILRTIESSLSPYEAQVLKEYFSGRSAKETAEVLGTDEKSVNNAVYRIRAKAKRLGNEKRM